jgi:acyl carrier protein
VTALEDLVAYINRELLKGRGAPIAPDTPLFEDSLIDSLNILQLIAFVEVRLGRAIPDHDIVMDRFRTPRRITEAFLS